MALFQVQRYLGDEDGSKNCDTAAEEKLDKLLLKINQRSKLKKIQSEKIVNKNILGSGDVSTSTFTRLKESIDIQTTPVNKKHKQDLLLDEKDKFQQSQKKGDNKNDVDESSLLDDFDRIKVNDNQDHIKENISDGAGCEMFPVIGDFKFKRKDKVRRVLPDWLTNPSVVSVDLKNLDFSINDVPGLHDIFINSLKKNNITHFFPVQAQVIPWLLESARMSSFFWPCDICVSAPTGSGKTLAYVLPILQALMGNRVGQIQAMVVLPVQELAAQVAAVFRCYSVGTGLRVHLSSGGCSLPEDRTQLVRQRMGVGWESLVDILVITPGRLVEHLYSTPGFSLKQLQYIVIDEADRVVDNIQNNWLHHLDHHMNNQGNPFLTLHSLKSLQRRPQKLLFSATLSIDPEKLNHLNLFQPRLFTSVVEATKDKGGDGEFIGKFTTPAELEERMVRCTLAVKPLVLYQLIVRDNWSRVLVFTSSSRSVHQLCALLSLLTQKTQHVLHVAEISAECSSRRREAVLTDFAAGRVDVLVSTDALARGMDIPNVHYVISYDMPKYVKAYIHRVGRTGRAGNQGMAITMVTHSQVGMFLQMLQTAGKQDTIKELTVDEQELKPLEETFKESLRQLKNVTEGEEMKKLHETKSLKRVISTKDVFKKRKKKKDTRNFSKRSKV